MRWTSRAESSYRRTSREYAGIDKEVVSVGVYSRVEIWSKDRYLENSDFDDMDEIADHMAELGIGI